MENLTPMMQQYFEIKKDFADAILFFRLGDFYEMFFDDAKIASDILALTLTGKACGNNQRAPMCGVPYHSSKTYIQKLINAGKKVAICEQVEDPKLAKGIVKREIIRVVTPGTVLDDEIIDKISNNFIMAIVENGDEFDISYADITTGQLSTKIVEPEKLVNIFYETFPKEILAEEDFYKKLEQKAFKGTGIIKSLIEQNNIMTNIINLDGLKEFEEQYKLDKNEKLSTKVIYKYIFDTQKVIDFSFFYKSKESKSMSLDYYSLKNLEVIEPLSRNNKYTLFWALNKTKTAMGARKLKEFLTRPSNDKEEIKNRLDIVDYFIKDYRLTSQISDELKNMYDLERITNKLAYNTINQKDLFDLKTSLFSLIKVYDLIEKSENEKVIDIFSSQDIEYAEIARKLIENSIIEPDIEGKKSKYIIKTSYDQRLVKYRKLIDEISDVLLELEQREKDRIGIKNLKVSYNKVFGYFIEISKASLNGVEIPSDYVRKQTLVSSERFVSNELNEIEQEILKANVNQDELETELYAQVKSELKKYIKNILSLARSASLLDVYISFAQNAIENDYVRPIIAQDEKLIIKNGRHPVIEKLLPDKSYVPNDTDMTENDTHIITGPNMAGKSTYMRQVATILIMAHIGSFVPCSFASVPITDSIFTRIGANDDLAMGKSTFMVEMLEVANILDNATTNSFIILDEIGRGTSTYDGMSLAFAIVEYIVKKINAKTLVSTHYHELTDLEKKYKNIVNYKMLVDDTEEVRFLRKIVKGKADKSYGIHVASLSGLPYEVLERAKVILDRLEQEGNTQVINKKTSNDNNANDTVTKQQNSKALDTQEQISIMDFKNETNLQIVEKIKKIQLDTLTPKQSMDLLYDIQSKLR